MRRHCPLPMVNPASPWKRLHAKRNTVLALCALYASRARPGHSRGHTCSEDNRRHGLHLHVAAGSTCCFPLCVVQHKINSSQLGCCESEDVWARYPSITTTHSLTVHLMHTLPTKNYGKEGAVATTRSHGARAASRDSHNN